MDGVIAAVDLPITVRNGWARLIADMALATIPWGVRICECARTWSRDLE
jgi:hypothetical protein